jgi:hypothetical protein
MGERLNFHFSRRGSGSGVCQVSGEIGVYSGIKSSICTEGVVMPAGRVTAIRGKPKQPQANRAKQGLLQEHSNTKDGREDKHRARCNHTQRCECEQQKIKVTIDGSNKPLQRDYSNRHGSFNHLQGDYNN